MKTSTKLIIAGTTIGVAVAGVLIAKHFIKVDKENHSVQIIGGADGPTSVFLAGTLAEVGEATCDHHDHEHHGDHDCGHGGCHN